MKMTEVDLDCAIQRLEDLGIGVPDAQRVSEHDLAEQAVEEASLRVALARSQYEISTPRVDHGTPPALLPKAVKKRSPINPAAETCGRESSPARNPAVEMCGKDSSPAIPAPMMDRTLASQSQGSNNLPPLGLLRSAPRPIRVRPKAPAGRYYAVTVGRCIGVYDNWYVFFDLSILFNLCNLLFTGSSSNLL